MSKIARTLAHVLTAAGLLFASQSSLAQSVYEQFDEMQPKLRRQLHSNKVEQRIDALKSLEKYRVAESARLVHSCFVDVDDSVRAAAYEALHKMNDEQEVCDALLAAAQASLKKRNGSPMVLPALAALLASDLPLAQVQAQQFMDEQLASSPQGPELLVALADELGSHGTASDVRPLARMSNAKLFAAHFGIRRAVVQALTKTPSEESLDPLIGMLGIVGGEAKADAVRYLMRATGQSFGLNVDAWQKWRLAERRETASAHTATVPSQLTVKVTRADELDSEAGQYYGIPLFAERLVFVLDISGSMQGGRMLAAKRELIRAIQGLPDYAHFGIVVFNGSVDRWQQKLMPANATNKKAAVIYVERQSPEGNTASYNALETALTYDTEAIYFLSDGAPTSGKILAPVDIIRAITTVNRVRRISIYTIGIAPGFPGSPTDEFLRTLSEKNSGQYRRVDG